MLRLKFLFVAVLSFYLTACGGSLTGIAEGVLYPFDQVDKSYQVPETPPDGLGQIYFQLKATDGSDMSVHAWFYKSPNPRARTLIHFHGNGENLQALQVSNFLGVLRQLKVNFIVIDYPGLGRSTGFPNQENLVAGGLAAVDWARKTFPQSHLIVWGRSLGAAVASQVAARKQSVLSGLVLTSGWSSFMDVAKDATGLAKNLPEEWVAAHRYDSAAAAATIHIPTMMHHGIIDNVIGLKWGEKLHDAFPAGVASLKEFAGISHNDLYTVQEFWTDLRNFNP